MKKRSAVFTLLVVAIIIMIFFVLDDYSESYQSLSDEEIFLARLGPDSLLSSPKNAVSQNDDGTLQNFKSRTLLAFAVLFALWSLCVFLAVRLNLFLKKADKPASKQSEKGDRS